MKWAGLVLITAVGTGLGLIFARNLQCRVAELRALRRLIAAVETDIRFRRTDLQGIFRRLAESDDYVSLPFLSPPPADTGADNPAAEILGRLRRAEGLHLTPEDRAVAESFFADLGRTDLLGQTEHCREHLRQTEARLAEAERESAEKQKLFLSLGFCSGLALALLLI